MNAVIRALDVGYGNVKHVQEHSNLATVPVCSKFPSRAPVASESDLGAGMLSRRNTVNVEVHGVMYEVGHDVTLAQGTFDESAVLDENFVLTDSYMARVLGAFHYMRDRMPGDTIDMLIVGLPVSTYDTHKDKLAEKLLGPHTLPFDRKVDVKEVKVFPQPLGAFFNYIYNAESENRLNYAEAKHQMNLVIDPGFFTFDWLLAKGMKSIPARSGAVYRGMSAVIKSMAEEISKKEGTNPTVVFRMLDDAIRDGLKLRVFGQEIDYQKYLPRAKNIITEAVSALSNSVGDGADIDNIMLAGGGAEFYLEAIQDKFPRHKIYTTKDAVFANVIGFQLAGERHYIDRIRKERRDSLVGA